MTYWGQNKKTNMQRSSSSIIPRFIDEELEEADRLIGPSNNNNYSLLGPEYYCRTTTNQERKSQQLQQKQEEKQESTLSREIVLVAELQEAKNIIHNLIWDRDTIIARFQEVQQGLLQQNSTININGSELQLLQQKLREREVTISLLEQRLKESDSERQSLQQIKVKYEQLQMNERQLNERIMKLECDVATERVKKETVMSQLEESRQRMLEEGARWRERCQNTEDRIRVLVELQQQQQQQSLLMLTSSQSDANKEQRGESSIILDRDEYTALVKKSSALETRLQLQCNDESQDGQLAWKTIQQELKHMRTLYYTVKTEKEKLQTRFDKIQGGLLEQQEKRTIAETELRTSKEKIEELEDLLERLAKETDNLREENKQLYKSERSRDYSDNVVLQAHKEGGEVMESQLPELCDNLETEKSVLQKQDEKEKRKEYGEQNVQSTEIIIILERALRESLLQRERYEAVMQDDMKHIKCQLEAAENALIQEIRWRERIQVKYNEERGKVLLLTSELRNMTDELDQLEKKVQKVTFFEDPIS